MMQSFSHQDYLLPTLGIALPLVVIVLLAVKLAAHSWHIKRKVKEASFVGLLGRAESAINESGLIFVRGELWHACSTKPIARGKRVRVVGYRNFQLEVEVE